MLASIFLLQVFQCSFKYFRCFSLIQTHLSSFKQPTSCTAFFALFFCFKFTEIVSCLILIVHGSLPVVSCVFSRQPRHESESLTLPCFCYGHSSRCSAQSGYSVHKITSTFTTGKPFSFITFIIKEPWHFLHFKVKAHNRWGDRLWCVSGVEDWKVGTMQGKTPADTHFRWSPKHQDVEVISKNSLPVYLYAPGESSPTSSNSLAPPTSLCLSFYSCYDWCSPFSQTITSGTSCWVTARTSPSRCVWTAASDTRLSTTWSWKVAV